VLEFYGQSVGEFYWLRLPDVAERDRVRSGLEQLSAAVVREQAAAAAAGGDPVREEG
jgi:hypothetical protein